MSRVVRVEHLCLLALTGAVFVGSVMFAVAGNKQIVDQTIQELDELNKQAVEQLPDLPKDGTVNLKADVTYENGTPIFDIYEEHVTPEKVEDIPLDQEYIIDLQTKGRKKQ